MSLLLGIWHAAAGRGHPDTQRTKSRSAAARAPVHCSSGQILINMPAKSSRKIRIISLRSVRDEGLNSVCQSKCVE